MKFIKPGLLFLLLALTTASLLADDINIFLRNRWDNVVSEEGKKGQMLFLLDLVNAESGACNTAWEEVDLFEPCTSGNCKTITASSANEEHGTIAPAPTWQVEAGNPGLFLITSNDGYRVNEVTGTCGGTLFDGNYYLTNPVNDNCTVHVSFVQGEEAFTCVPGDGSGGTADGKYPSNQAECLSVGGLWSDGTHHGGIVLDTNYASYNSSNRVSFTGCMLPSAGPGSGGGGGEICYPPTFQRRTCPSASVLADYRPSIEAIMRARPDVKYGVYGLTATGARQVFPLEERDEDELEIAIARLNSSDSNVFPRVTGDRFPTLSALDDIYNYLIGPDSPLTNECQTTQFVMFATGGYSGDESKFSQTFDLKDKINEYYTAKGKTVPTSYPQLLVGIADYLNNDSSNEDFNIYSDVESRVKMHIVAVNPDSSQILFNGSPSVAEQMTTASKGSYTPLTLDAGPDANRLLGESIVNTVLGVMDYAYEGSTTFTSPIAAASLSRGYHLDDFIVTAFEPAIDSKWRGNIHRTTQSSLPIQQATDFDSFSTFSFPSTRTIYTNACASGEICVLSNDSGLTEEQIAWLKNGSGIENDHSLLGDVIHFRPMPINYGENKGTYYVVGTNRGLLHLFGDNNVEKWAFLPAQLVNTVRALHSGRATRPHAMVNKFYGVDGQPTVFIYDHEKDGEIQTDGNDRVILSYGLRRGGAGYYSMDITDPDTMPDLLIAVGSSEIAHGPLIESMPIFDGDGQPIIEEESEGGPIEPTEGYGGGCSQFFATQGSLLSTQKVAVQCGNAKRLGGGLCGGGYNDMCLQYSCDKVGAGFTGSHKVFESAPIASFLGYAPDGGPIFTAKKDPACSPQMSCHGGRATFTPNVGTHYSTMFQAGVNCYAGNTADNQGAKGHLVVGALTSGESSAMIGFDIDGLPENIQITKATLSLAHTGPAASLNDVNPSAVYSSGVNVYVSNKGCYGNSPFEEGSPGTTSLDCTDTNHTLLGTLNDPGSYEYGSRASITVTNLSLLNDIFFNKTKVNTYTGNNIVWNGSQFERSGTFTDTYTWVQFKVSRQGSGTGRLAFGSVREGETISDQEAARVKGWNDYFNTITPKLHLEWDCLLESPERLLKVEIEGTEVELGSVVSTPAGIDCHIKSSPSDPDPVCSSMFRMIDDVTLTASPASSFTQWSGDDANACADVNNPVCTLSMSKARSIKALFGQVVPISWRLNLTVEGSGTVTSSNFENAFNCGTGGTRCQALFGNEEVVILTATPDPDRDFLGFTGCDSVSGNSCTVKMESDTYITAQFQREPGHFDLTVLKEGEGDVSGTGAAVIDCGSSCTATGILEGGVITLSYSAKAGHQFSHWSGACSGSGACVVTLDSDKTVRAHFEPEFVCRDFNTSMSSHVSAGRAVEDGLCWAWSTSCNWRVVGSNETISLPYAERNNPQSIAETSAGHFKKGSCIDFLPPQYDLVVNRAGTGQGVVVSSPAGINCGDNCSIKLDPDTAITLTATPESSTSTFDGWSGGCTGTGNCVLTMNGAKNVSATFNMIQYDVTATVDGGFGTATPATQKVDINTSTYITLNPNPGYEIDLENTGGCGGDVVNSQFVTAPITANCAVVVKFKKSESDFYTVTATAGPNGSVTPPSQLIEVGKTTEIEITPASSYVIDSIVSECGGGTLSSSGETYTTAPITSDCNVNVTFKAKPTSCSAVTDFCSTHIYSYSRLTAKQSFMTTSGVDRIGNEACSGYASVTIYCPSSGLCYKNLSDCEEDHGVSSTYYTVTTDGGASVTFSPASKTVPSGSTHTFALNVSEGYELTSVTGCGGTLSGTTYTTGSITTNCMITANTALKSYKVTTQADHGTITPSNPTVSHGATTKLTVEAAYGYKIAGVTGCGGNLSGNEYTTGAITGPCTVTATFSKLSYTVTTSVTGTGGSIVPPTRDVEYLGTTTFELVAEEGYEIESASGCGGSLSGTTFTTGSITENCEVKAKFKLKEYTVTADAGTMGTVDKNSETVQHGATASFIFTANTGYELLDVTGCGVGILTGNTYTTAPITEACNVTAEFGKLSYTVTASAGANGAITPPERPVEFQDTTTFTITPNAGYEIDEVKGSCPKGTLEGNLYTTGAITDHCTVEVSFGAKRWNVTAQVASGSGTITPPTRSVLEGQTTTFTVAAATGYSIQSVAGCNGSLEADGETFTTGPITADCVVNAIFSKLSYTVTATAGPNGSASPATQNVEYQDSAQIQIAPDTNYKIVEPVGGTCGGSLNGTTYITAPVTANCTVSVTFEPIPIPPETLTVKTEGVGSVSSSPAGISCGSNATCTHDYDAGTVVTLTASAGSGNDFLGWSRGGCTGTGTCTVTMVEARTVIASFGTPSGGGCDTQITGTCQEQVNAGRLEMGGLMNMYVVDAKDVNHETCTTYYMSAQAPVYCRTSGELCFHKQSDCLAGGPIGPTQRTVTGTVSGSGGTITPPTQQVDDGTSTELVVLADVGYEINTVSGCNGSMTGLTTYTTGNITSNCTVTATFKTKNHTVTTTAGTGGSISPTNPSVGHGMTQAFSVTAQSGYEIDSVVGCGGSLSGNTYTTGPITGPCGVIANFKESLFTVSASAGPNGSVSPTSQTGRYGDVRTVTVTPAPNYEIANVTGCGGSLSGNTYTTAGLTASCTINATFKIKTYTVSANAGTGGSISPTSQLVNHGSTLTLTLSPNEGYSVDTVTGCNGTRSGNSYTTGAVTANCSVTATFSLNQYEVSASAGANGSITPETRSVNHGSTTTFTVSPSANYEIDEVKGCGGTLSGTTYTTGIITMPCAVTATFKIKTYTVTANAGTGGSITPSTKTVDHGATTTFIVATETGYSVDTVTGCGGQLNGTTYTTGGVTANCTVTATFSLNKYEVSASAGANGSITPESRSVNHGSTTTFTVSPAANYEIDEVKGCEGSLSGNTWTTGVITAPCAVTATFKIKTYTISTNAGAGGSITPSSKTMDHGATTTFTVSPNTGYEIVSVNGCGGSLSGTTWTTGAITQNCTISATFTKQSYSVTASAGPNGTISPPSRSVLYQETTTFTVTPSTGYEIDNVTGCGGALSGNTYTTGSITGACSVSATFKIKSYLVDATAGTGGSISPTSKSVEHGGKITFTATPSTGYQVASIAGCNGTRNGNNYETGAITQACTVTATFSKLGYTVTATGTSGGTVSPATQTVLYQEKGTVTVTPDTGYTAVVAGSCGGSLSGNTYTTNDITGNCSVEVTFSKNVYTATATAGANGTISPASQPVAHGDTTTFTVTPNTGYSASVGGTCGGSLSGNTYTTNAITGNCTVEATFSKLSYTVTASSNAGGSITPDTASVLYQDQATFTVKPNTGYSVAMGGTCGGSLSGTTYTTNAITDNCTVEATFTINSYTVTSSKTGNGTITPSSTSVTHGSVAEFTVTPHAGHEVTMGGTCGGALTGNTYTTWGITASCTVTAAFTPINYTVSASGNAGGTITPATQTVAYNNTTTLTVKPNAGYSVAMSGTCGGSLSGTTYTTNAVKGDCTVVATFTINSYTVTASGSSGGTVSPATQNIDHGSKATITVTPNTGYTATIGGTCGGSLSGNTYTTDAVTANCSVTVAFVINQYTVSASKTGNGTITPASDKVDHGATTTFTVTPDTGHNVSVGGTCGGSLSGTTYTTAAITGNCTVEATFTPKTFTVSASGNAGGTITPATQNVAYNNTTTFSVKPNTGYSVAMSGTCGGSLSGTTYTTSAVTANCTVIATFTINSYTVTASKTGSGTISPASQSVDHGSTTTFTVTPVAGQNVSMGGTCGGSLSGTTYTTSAVTENCTVVATFTPKTYTVSASKTGNGTITPPSQSVDHGSTTTFTVTPATGHNVSVGGTCGGSLSGTTYTTSAISANCTVVATFTPKSYTVSASKTGNGTITPPSQSVDHGLTTTFTVTPATGHEVTMGGTCGGSLSGTTYTTSAITGNCTVVATFVPKSYTVSASKMGNGTITPASQSVDHGLTTTFTVTPDTGHNVSVGGTCGGSLSGTTYTTSAISANCTVVATFTPKSYTVSASKTGNGTISPTSQSVDHGSTTTFTVEPAAGQKVTMGGTCGGSLSGTTYTTNTITGNCTVEATFTQITYKVTSSASAGGSISPSGEQTVNHGATTTFTLSANSGYTISSVGGTCGGSRSGTTYTTNAITANCTVIANFVQDSVTLTVTKTGTGTGTVTGNGINCGSTCSTSIPASTNVSLSVTLPAVISTTVTDGFMYSTTRDEYSTFAGWSGGCTGTGNCVMNPIGSSKTVTAKFDKCIRTSVYRHWDEGRTVTKTSTSFWTTTTSYHAKGSETYLADQGIGTYTTYFSLRETSPGYWEVVSSCN